MEKGTSWPGASLLGVGGGGGRVSAYIVYSMTKLIQGLFRFSLHEFHPLRTSEIQYFQGRKCGRWIWNRQFSPALPLVKVNLKSLKTDLLESGLQIVGQNSAKSWSGTQYTPPPPLPNIAEFATSLFLTYLFLAFLNVHKRSQ